MRRTDQDSRLLTHKPTVGAIRTHLSFLYKEKIFVKDKSGCDTVELLNASFVADEPTIFGKVNEDYVRRELEWYNSQSLFVQDIPGNTPVIWDQVSAQSPKGKINSNYGWCIYSEENHSQYSKVLDKLSVDPYTRQAVMIYTRPTMHEDAREGGMSDFMCTNTVQYLVSEKDGNLYLNSRVDMRSNDAWAGYRNDYAWQKHVLNQLVVNLNEVSPYKFIPGTLFWNVGSLHLYERDFWRIEKYLETGNHEATKKD